jgi:hypothetical protein
MTQWNQSDVRSGMKVYASDGEHIGHIAAVYEDSFLIHKGYVLPTDRYLPYSAIDKVEQQRVLLTLSSEQVEEPRWTKRPNYQQHMADPTQLFYDEGHGIRNPYEETGSQHPGH